MATEINTDKVVRAQLLTGGLSTIGSVAGIVVAIKRKSGILGGIGWFFLGGFAGAAVGQVINSTRTGYTK